MRGVPGEASADATFDVFLSYSHDPDYDLARHLDAFLESFHTLPAIGGKEFDPISVCRDGSDFRSRRHSPGSAGAGGVQEAILAELRRSENLLVLCSEAAARSSWVLFEVGWFLSNRGPERIMLAMTEGEDPAVHPERFIPPPLREAGFDGSIWYDLRGFRKRQCRKWRKVRMLDDECVQIACHLNDAALGTVRPLYFARKEEEERRRRRSMTLWAGAVAVAGVLAAGAGVTALVNAKRAETERVDRLNVQKDLELKTSEAESAVSEAVTNRLRGIASLSRRAFDSGDCVAGLRYSMSGLAELDKISLDAQRAELERLFLAGVSSCPLLSELQASANHPLITQNGEAGIFDGVKGLGIPGSGEWNAIWNIRERRYIGAIEKNRRDVPVLFHELPLIGVFEDDGAFRVYSAVTGKAVAGRSDIWGKQGSEEVSSLTGVSSPDGRLIAIGAAKERLRILPMDPKKPMVEFGAPGLKPYGFSRDGKRLLAADESLPGVNQVWDTENLALLHEGPRITNPRFGLFLPGTRGALLWGSTQEAVSFWSFEAANEPVALAGVGNEKLDFVVLDRRGRLALVVDLLRVYVYDLERRRVVSKVDEELCFHAAPAFLPDGQAFVAGAVKCFVRGARPFLGVWRVSDGQLLARFPVRGNVRSVGLAADGSRVTTADEEAFAQMWDLGWLNHRDNVPALRRHACEARLIATAPIPADKLTDPILRQTGISAPCGAAGQPSSAAMK